MKRFATAAAIAFALAACGDGGRSDIPQFNEDYPCGAESDAYNDTVQEWNDRVEVVNDAGGISQAPPDDVASMEAAGDEMEAALDALDACEEASLSP